MLSLSLANRTRWGPIDTTNSILITTTDISALEPLFFIVICRPRPLLLVLPLPSSFRPLATCIHIRSATQPFLSISQLIIPSHTCSASYVGLNLNVCTYPPRSLSYLRATIALWDNTKEKLQPTITNGKLGALICPYAIAFVSLHGSRGSLNPKEGSPLSGKLLRLGPSCPIFDIHSHRVSHAALHPSITTLANISARALLYGPDPMVTDTGSTLSL